MASSSSSPYGWQDSSRTRRSSNGGPNSGSAKPQSRPMSTPRRVVLNSPYSNMPANPMALPEDIRPPIEEDTDSNTSTDDFWEQDEDLRQIIQGQLKEKSTDAHVPVPQAVTRKDPLKLDFPAAEVDSPWEEWQTVSETPIASGHPTPFAPIGAPVSSPGFPEPSASMPEPQRDSQMAMPVPPPRFPTAQSHDTPGYFGMPSRRFTEDEDLDSPSQRIPGRYPLYRKPKLPIQEEDDTPPTKPLPIPLASTPSIYPPVQSSVGVQADLLPQATPPPSFPNPHAAGSPPVPSIYSESSSISPDDDASGTPAPTWAPPPASSDVNDRIWGKPTAPLKLAPKVTSGQQPPPAPIPTPPQKPHAPAITHTSSSPPTGTPANAASQSFSQATPPNVPTANTSSTIPQGKPLAQPAKPPHVAPQKPPASIASSSYARPDKPTQQIGNPHITTSNIGSTPAKPASSIHPTSSFSNAAPTPIPQKPPVKPAVDMKPEPTPSKPPAAASSSSKPDKPEPQGRPSHISATSQHTRYVNMLLALDDIPQWFNLMASFFTWILLAGFLLFPGTFTNLQQAANETESEFERRILTAVTNVPL